MAKENQFNPLILLNEKSEDIATIIVEGTIGCENNWDHEKDENTNRKMAEELNRIKSLKAKTVFVKIHSLGGNVDHALAIYDQLKDLKAKIITQINGMCASAATIIFAAGEERKMSRNALFLIHQCWGLIIGNENQVKAQLESLKTIDNRMFSIYKDSGVTDEKKLKDLISVNNGTGKWISADEVKEMGFCTEIYNETAKAASFSREMFNQTGLPAIPQGYSDLIESEEKKNWFDDLKDLKEDINEFFSQRRKNKENNINNQTNTEMKKFSALFPVMFAILAFKQDPDYDKDKGTNFTDEQLNAIEGQLKAYNDLKTENEKLKTDKAKVDTDLAEAVKKKDELQAKVDATPAPVAQVSGSDPQKESDFEAYQKASPFYSEIGEK